MTQKSAVLIYFAAEAGKSRKKNLSRQVLSGVWIKACKQNFPNTHQEYQLLGSDFPSFFRRVRKISKNDY